MTDIKLSKDHIYTVDGIKKISVTQVIQEYGLSDFSMINEQVLKNAMAIGTAVHLLCELFDKDMPDKIDKILNHISEDGTKKNGILKPYLDAWIKYQTEYQIGLSEVEKIYYSKTWDYCGKIDRILQENGILSVVEIKTVTVLQKSVGIQLAAYKNLYDENNKEKIKDRIAVQLCPDGNYNRVEYKDKNDINVFKCMMTILNYKKNSGILKGDK